MATNYAQQDANNKTIQEAKREYAAAQARGDTAGMQAAHAKAEAERAKSGYSGGTNGATYSSKPTSPTSSGSKKKSSNTGAYTIGTQAGNDAYNSLVNGTISAFSASDGSVWRYDKNDGNVYVTQKDGSIKVARNNYANGGNVSNKPNVATGLYTIGTSKGNDYYNAIINGQLSSFTNPTDGSYWYKGNDGNVYVTEKDGSTKVAVNKYVDHYLFTYDENFYEPEEVEFDTEAWKNSYINTILPKLQANYASNYGDLTKTYNTSYADLEDQKSAADYEYEQNKKQLDSDVFKTLLAIDQLASQRGLTSSAQGISMNQSALAQANTQASQLDSERDQLVNSILTQQNLLTNNYKTDVDTLDRIFDADTLQYMSTAELEALEKLLDVSKFNSDNKNSFTLSKMQNAFNAAESAKDRVAQGDLADKNIAAELELAQKQIDANKEYAYSRSGGGYYYGNYGGRGGYNYGNSYSGGGSGSGSINTEAHQGAADAYIALKQDQLTDAQLGYLSYMIAEIPTGKFSKNDIINQCNEYISQNRKKNDKGSGTKGKIFNNSPSKGKDAFEGRYLTQKKTK